MYGNRGNRGSGRGGFHDLTPPVKVGDEFDVRIEAVGEKGDGIAKKQNFVIFVPGVKEGDTIRVRVTKVLRKVGFGEKIGDAQGPVEQSQPSSRPAPSQEERMDEPAEAEPAPEDSENFGEEQPEELGDDSEETYEEER
ncbi:TRAM domain-containing protein [Candidatus Woesearchaeota archaeon]|nr:TRAM domain-containing protein [Candidatus Woesearchaeota archaeon]